MDEVDETSESEEAEEDAESKCCVDGLEGMMGEKGAGESKSGSGNFMRLWQLFGAPMDGRMKPSE